MLAFSTASAVHRAAAREGRKSLATAHSADYRKRMGNSYALVIAIESYVDKTIQRVRFAENDANGIVTTLVELGYDRRDINLLQSSAATKTTIESAARLSTKMLQADDTVFIFYAGHGFASGGHNHITAYDNESEGCRTNQHPNAVALRLLSQDAMQARQCSFWIAATVAYRWQRQRGRSWRLCPTTS